MCSSCLGWEPQPRRNLSCSCFWSAGVDLMKSDFLTTTFSAFSCHPNYSLSTRNTGKQDLRFCQSTSIYIAFPPALTPSRPTSSSALLCRFFSSEMLCVHFLPFFCAPFSLNLCCCPSPTSSLSYSPL